MKRNFYWQYLDSIRFFAVFIVLINHFADKHGIQYKPISLGIYGVDLFFVISGFLITYILLDQKNRTIPHSKILRGFFIKRLLRLFPLYYFLLAITLLIEYVNGPIFNLTPNWIWYFSYTSNFLYVFYDSHSRYFLDPTWSLAVEEQFYIFWPFLIVFIKPKRIKIVILLFISSAFVFVYFCVSTHFHGRFRFLPISNFNTLGVGALLAYFQFNYPEKLIKYFYKKIEFLIIFFGILFCLIVLHPLFNDSISNILQALVLTIFTSSIVLYTIWDFKNQKNVQLLVGNRFFSGAGKISYGMYLLHLPILTFIDYLLGDTSNQNHNSTTYTFLYFIVYFFITIILAHLSWKYFESYFIKLKAKYNY